MSRAQKTDQPATDAQIVEALRRKAGKGDAAAARELREWLDRDLVHEDQWAWLDALSPERRELLGQWLAEEGRPEAESVAPSE